MHSTSATMIGDLYHDPRGYYAADVLHHAIQTQTGLTWNRWDGREPSVDPETLANSFLIGAGDRWTVVVKDYNGHWVHKDDTHTLPIVFLYKFLSAKSKSGSVYYFGDLKTKTIHDRVTALRPQKRASQHHSKGQSKPRGGRKTPSPNKAKKQPPSPQAPAAPPTSGPFPVVPGDLAFQVQSPADDDPTPPICSNSSNHAPTQQFNNVVDAHRTTFVPVAALQSDNPGWTYGDAPLGGQIPPSVNPDGPQAQFPAPDPPDSELS